jgi:hypothetical protein
MTKDETLRLALEALTNAYWPTDSNLLPAHNIKECGEAISAIKEALAQSEPNYKKALEVWLDKTEWVQETVKPHELGMHRADVLKQRIEAALAQPEHGWTPERIAGMARLKEAQDKKFAQPELEPVAWEQFYPEMGSPKLAYLSPTESLDNACYIPPQRKPLSDEEIEYVFKTNSVMVDNGNAYMVAGLRAVNIARAIEAAHGIKENT